MSFAGNSNTQLEVWNDKRFACMWQAGINLTKYKVKYKNKNVDVKDLCEYVGCLLAEQTMPVHVVAKLVHGLTQIYFIEVQLYISSLISFQHLDTRGTGISKKSVIKRVEVNVDDIVEDREIIAMLEANSFLQPLTEQDIIECLRMGEQHTTVKNVDDITMRDEPTSMMFSGLEGEDEEGFGPEASREMLNFLSQNHEDEESHQVEPSTTQDMDFELVSKEGNTDTVAPLEEQLKPLPEENSLIPDEQISKLLSTMESTCSETNVADDLPNSPATPSVGVTETSSHKLKRSMKIQQNVPTKTRLSYEHMKKCFTIGSIPIDVFFVKDLQRKELQALQKERRLKALFTEPLRSFSINSLYTRNANGIKRKTNFNESKIHKRNRTSSPDFSNHVLSDKTAGDRPQHANPIEQNENPSSQEQQKTSISSLELHELLQTYWTTESTDCISFQLFQPLLTNRQIAASLFAKILFFSAAEMLVVMKNEDGTLCNLRKGVRWDCPLAMASVTHNIA